eukprot:scaffold6592_cov411-Prasinococcus_capsulatus_cf.AAC.6
MAHIASWAIHRNSARHVAAGQDHDDDGHHRRDDDGDDAAAAAAAADAAALMDSRRTAARGGTACDRAAQRLRHAPTAAKQCRHRHGLALTMRDHEDDCRMLQRTPRCPTSR